MNKRFKLACLIVTSCLAPTFNSFGGKLPKFVFNLNKKYFTTNINKFAPINFFEEVTNNSKATVGDLIDAIKGKEKIDNKNYSCPCKKGKCNLVTQVATSLPGCEKERGFILPVQIGKCNKLTSKEIFYAGSILAFLEKTELRRVNYDLEKFEESESIQDFKERLEIAKNGGDKFLPQHFNNE